MHTKDRRGIAPRLRAIASILGALFFLVPMGNASANPPLTVTLKSCPSSTVTGFVGNYPGGATGSIRQFLNIPYAAPPTGANRWRPPQAVQCWSGNRDALMFGPSCPQDASLQPWMNEDCLSLNVFTPSSGTYSKLPVMVFIHGGALIGGSASFFGQNPIDLVKQGVIVVTIQYRLGALGFLAHSALDNVTAKSTGNYGIQDQQAAFKWVKTNIVRFGGDPLNVTIFGQSAGGLSVLVHLVSPLSTGLFQKAIIESGALYATPTLLSIAEGQGATFAQQMGCSTASCLRGLSVNTILANQTSNPLTLGQSTALLRQDNVVLKDTIMNLLMTGQFAKVPIINGSNHDEQRFHLAGNPNPAVGSPPGDRCNYKSNITPFSYHAAMQTAFGGQASTVEGQYPAGATDLSANIGFTASQTDRNFACRAWRVSNWIAQAGGTIYAYEFNDPNPPQYMAGPLTLQDNTKFPYGAYHGAELQYVFRIPNTVSCLLPYTPLTAKQKALGSAMVTYWTTFAKTGSPNLTTLPRPTVWPLYKASGGRMLSLLPAAPAAITAASFDSAHKCSSFWNANGP